MPKEFTFNTRQLFVPANISNLSAFLTSQGWTQRQIDDHQDKIAYTLNRILTAPLYNKRIGAGDYVAINHDVLANVIGNRYVKFVLDTLLSAGAIECDNMYSKKSGKSYGYRITEQVDSKPVGLLIFKQETFGRKLAAWTEKMEVELRKDRFLNRIHKDMKNLRIHHREARRHNETVYEATQDFIVNNCATLDTTKVKHRAYTGLLDEAMAISELIHLPSFKKLTKVLKHGQKEDPTLTVYKTMMRTILKSYSKNLIAIDKLHTLNIKVPIRPDKLSRVYTILTNLSSQLRPFLYHVKHPEETLVNLDIANSQPFLLSLLLVKRYDSHDLPGDVKHYIELTSSGKFYEFVAQANNVHMRTKRERRDFKTKFFASIFFCKNKHTESSKIGKWFRDTFPKVYQLIYDYKLTDHAELAVAMQKEEARIILDTVVARLQPYKIWAASIHDSIICLESDATLVHAIMTNAFQASYGLNPTITPEPLKPK
ncbi:hypothetical protein [Hymenobacter volaticus]|uniref:DNA-directed DNA polymerase family A palm domain-containing protein n=1 Tax=Hymenobacter volaticus TaxID=2932254 RepID=A0ABY4G1V6_9BACT|nr:hypothetical protein [Hymenobacter volaticus]UOQ64855.1 hypothetical protein MUN86_14930 [Hymenobacter volaticus]